MIKCHYDENTHEIKAWLNLDLLEDREPSIEVTEEQWGKGVSENHNYIDIETGITSKKDFRTDEEFIEQTKNKLSKRFNKIANNKSISIYENLFGYNGKEVFSVEKSKYEKLLLEKDSGEYSETTNALAEINDLTVEEYVDSKIDDFKAKLDKIEEDESIIEFSRESMSSILSKLVNKDSLILLEEYLVTFSEYDFTDSESTTSIEDVKNLILDFKSKVPEFE